MRQQPETTPLHRQLAAAPNRPINPPIIVRFISHSSAASMSPSTEGSNPANRRAKGYTKTTSTRPNSREALVGRGQYSIDNIRRSLGLADEVYRGFYTMVEGIMT